jgi:hypothetical protein
MWAERESETPSASVRVCLCVGECLSTNAVSELV